MDLLALYDFNATVRGALLAYVDDLPADLFTKDAGIGFGSIRDTFVHVANTEAWWFEAFVGGGTTHRAEPTRFPDVASLRPFLDDAAARHRPFLATLSPETLASVRERERRDGTVSRMTVEEFLLTPMLHDIYHKGEVLAVLRQHGHDGPPVDYWMYK
jgi:uncharacterized damage-inducible protein DinB